VQRKWKDEVTLTEWACWLRAYGWTLDYDGGFRIENVYEAEVYGNRFRG